MKIHTKSAVVAAAIVAASMTLSNTALAATTPNISVTSRGLISYDNNGDEIEETLLDSEDLRTLSGAIDSAVNEQNQYAEELDQLKKELTAYQTAIEESNGALSANKSSIVNSLQTKFKGDAEIDALKSTSSFAEIKAAIDSVINRGELNKSLNAGQSVSIPRGYYSGGKITANKMTGTYNASTEAEHHTTANGKATWDMGDTNMNRYVSVPTTSASATALNAGKSVTINPGYVESAITINANSLSSQTGGTATASDMLSGKTAWVNGKQVTGNIGNASVTGATNDNDGYTATIVAKKYTGTSGSSVTINKASVSGEAQSNGTFKYSIAGGSYTGANGSSGSIAKMTPTYSSGSTQSAVKASGTVTIPANTYVKDKLTITADSLANQTSGTAVADDMLSGKTAWVSGKQVTGTIGNASVSGAVNDKDGYTVSIAAKKYTGTSGSSVTIAKGAVSGAVNANDGYTATIAGGKYTGASGSSVTVAKGSVTGAVNANDGYTATIAGGKYTGKSGSSVTVNKASVTGAAQSDGTFKYSIAGGSYTGKDGSSGSIAKMTPTYSSGSSQANLVSGGTVTIPANTYVKDKIVITGGSMTKKYDVTGKGTAGASGKPETNTAKVYWDMGANNMNRYVSLNKLTASNLTVESGGGKYNALVAGHSLTIPANYYVSEAITVKAVNDYDMKLVENSNGTNTLYITTVQ